MIGDADPFWVQGHMVNVMPIAGMAAPAGSPRLPGLFINLSAFAQDLDVLTGMALMRGHILDAAVAVYMVVPVCKLSRPLPGVCQ